MRLSITFLRSQRGSNIFQGGGGGGVQIIIFIELVIFWGDPLSNPLYLRMYHTAPWQAQHSALVLLATFINYNQSPPSDHDLIHHDYSYYGYSVYLDLVVSPAVTDNK